MKFVQRFQKEKNDLVIIILRFGIGSVFLWFGLHKWISPEDWYGWVPPWLWQYLPMPAEVFMYLNGTFEVVVGTLLVTGRLVRPAAAAAGLFLLSILPFVGWNEISVRDMGLLGGCLALFVHANAEAKKRMMPLPWIAKITAGYVILLFVVGILYLCKAGPECRLLDWAS